MAQAVRTISYPEQPKRRRVQAKPSERRFSVANQPVPMRLQDFLWYIVAGIVALTAFICYSVVNTQIETANQLAATTTVQTQSVRDKNNTLKEEISALTTQTRLNKVASKAGLRLQNGNIKNVK
ncbi:hypothetical protein D0499_02750 [Weissella soli]|uniref:hypothetical protein n=1 Tax=Weissella soli TaxID=155866 RepID=UPI0021C01815|nr:hypothetical protein [Weissella soli]MCT8394730.1 hypothetical protein [Weissella soli]